MPAKEETSRDAVAQTIGKPARSVGHMNELIKDESVKSFNIKTDNVLRLGAFSSLVTH
jgi:hypothetical protein